MRELAGKTAFVTGGAGGIGFALGQAFAQAGMKVMLADIEADALQAAVESLQEISPDIRGTICDVTDAASVERAAQATFDAFGRVHVVCNNAGVAAGGGIDRIVAYDMHAPESIERGLRRAFDACGVGKRRWCRECPGPPFRLSTAACSAFRLGPRPASPSLPAWANVCPSANPRGCPSAAGHEELSCRQILA